MFWLKEMTPSPSSQRPSWRDSSVFSKLARIGSLPSFSNSKEKITDFHSINEVWSGKDPVVDIVFIDGLGLYGERTWRRTGTSELWPKSILSKDLPETRLLICGFDVLGRKDNFVEETARLWETYKEWRKDLHQTTPIILIAHSIGCLIVEQLVMKTFEPQERDRIRGIVFFGPPHFGFNLNSWEKFSSKIGQCVGQSGVGLPYDEFGRLNLQFGNWLNRLEYAFDILVTEENNTLKSVTVCTLVSDHLHMAQFESRSDTGYRQLVLALKRMASNKNGYTKTQMDSPILEKHLKKSPSIDSIVDDDETDEHRWSDVNYAQAILGKVLEDHGYYDDAERAYLTAKENIGDDPDAQNTITPLIEQRQTRLLQYRGKCREAEELARELFDRRKHGSKLKKPFTLAVVGQFGSILRDQNKDQEAFRLIRQVFENTIVHAWKSTSSLLAINVLASIFRDCGDHITAVQLSRNAFSISTSLYTDTHPETFVQKTRLAFDLALEGHLAIGESLAVTSLDDLEMSRGKSHPDSLFAARILAICNRFSKKYLPASQLLDKIDSWQRDRQSLDHPSTLATRREMAAIYALQGFIGESVAILRDIRSSQESTYGSDHRHCRWTVRALEYLHEVADKHRKQPETRPLPESDPLRNFPEAKEFFETPSRMKCDINFSPETQGWEDQISIIMPSLREKDIATLTNIISNPFDKNILGQITCVAASLGNQEALQILLAKDASLLDYRSGYYGSPLGAAALQADAETVKLLLQKGASIDRNIGIFGSPLQIATFHGHDEIVRLLLDKKADPTASTQGSTTAFQLAVSHGHLDILELFLTSGADPNTRDILFDSPLQEACARRYSKITKLLLHHGADPTSKGGLFGNASNAALQTGSKDCLSLLIEHSLEAVSPEIFLSDKFWALFKEDEYIDFRPISNYSPPLEDSKSPAGNPPSPSLKYRFQAFRRKLLRSHRS